MGDIEDLVPLAAVTEAGVVIVTVAGVRAQGGSAGGQGQQDKKDNYMSQSHGRPVCKRVRPEAVTPGWRGKRGFVMSERVRRMRATTGGIPNDSSAILAPEAR
jgi:hypothetical protein